MIDNLESAGLGFFTKMTETKQKLGKILILQVTCSHLVDSLCYCLFTFHCMTSCAVLLM